MQTPLTVGELGEFGVIDRIRAAMPGRGKGVVVGIGDDAAVLRPAAGMLLVATCDIQLEGRHFLRVRTTAEALGHRAAAVNLSDIAAMGATPRHALVSLGLPKELEVAWLDDFYKGLGAELGRYGASVVGGNLTSSEQLIIDITLLGEVAPGRQLLRSGAKPGDAILVSGTLGASFVGRVALDQALPRSDRSVKKVVMTHRTPTPRIKEGLAISRSGLAHAMMDVSDGLAADLGHICEMSKVGARLFAADLPVDNATVAVGKKLGVNLLDAVLHGGEDYQLILTCPQVNAKRLAARVLRQTGTPLTVIGEITKQAGLRLVTPDGAEGPLRTQGWDHFAVEK